MPNFEPISAMKDIRGDYPELKILVVSAYDDDVYVQGSVVLFPGQNLFVMSVMTSDAGLYECVAINAAGSDSVHFDLSVFGLFTRHQITHMYCPIT